MCQNFFVGRRLSGFSLYFAFELAEHDKLVGIGLLAASINLQVAQHERSFAVSLQENKWIRRPEFRRVQHVRIGFARGDDEAGLSISDFGFRISDFHFHLVPAHLELFSQNPMEQYQQSKRRCN